MRSRSRRSVVLVENAAEYLSALHRCAERHDDLLVGIGWSLVAGLPGRYLSSQMRQFRSVHLGFEYRLVDPGLLRHDRGVWPAAEPLGGGVAGGGESVLPGLGDRAEIGRGSCRERG